MADSRKTEREAAAWLARRDAAAWSAGDQRALDAWLEESTAHRVAWLRLASAWAEAGRLQALAAGLPSGQVPARDRWSPWRTPARPATLDGPDAPATPAPPD